jgi:DNA-directed RNA polymerase specialized sigma24 family protein
MEQEKYMHLQHTKVTKDKEAGAYATADDLRKLFAEQMDNLHLLAFLLTGDNEKAQECIVDSILECGNGNQVFRRWARAWVRRTIVTNAIRIVAPRPNRNSQGSAPLRSEVDFETQTQHETDPAILRLLRLHDFERFVIVMSVFEGYSAKDCSVLLGCAEQDIRETRERALENISAQELGHGDTKGRRL